MSVTPLIAGNWKMNGLGRDLETISAIATGAPVARVHTMICPPFPLLREAVGASANTTLAIGAQDCHVGDAGAHTGDVSAAMIKDAGAGAVIVGHSERRSDHGETDAVVKAKAAAALGQDLTAIICVGETAGQRQSNQAEAVVLRQLGRSLPAGATSDNIVIAYEPVWAIGTGLTATPDDVAAMHGAIREALVQRFGAGGSDIALLYGGSVKPGNAAELLRVANVNGALVGGASLKAEDFLAIVNAAC